MTKKSHIFEHLYHYVLVIVFGAMITFMVISFYNINMIFPAHAPQNLEELNDWGEKELFRLMKSLKCSSLGFATVPEELRQLKQVCSAVTILWGIKYNARMLEEAREGLKYLPKIGD